MPDTMLQILLFVMFVGVGAVTRLAYLPLKIAQNKVKNRFFEVVTDVCVATLGAACMMLISFLLAGNVRVFYALFFIGGFALMHMVLDKPTKKLSKKGA